MIIAVYHLLRRHWRLVVATTVLSVGASTAVALLSKPVYQGEALVMYAAAEQGNETLALLTSRLGGLAPLAGISGESAGGRAEAIATLKSRQLGTAFIEERDLLPHLFPDLWDTEQNNWAVEAEAVPTMADAFERFDEDVRRVDEDRTTGLISVSIFGRDRVRVAEWANALVQETNDRLRQRAIEEAEQSVRYLEEQLTKTTILEVRQAINQLIEAQISKAALANTRDDYAFRVIDPAVVLQADKFVKPQRILIVALGAAFGMALGFLLALLHQSWHELRQGGLGEQNNA